MTERKPEIGLTIKTEPGTYKRLPSLRSPRDLTLSEFRSKATPGESKPKKVYVPNLNVQRRKPSEESVAETSKSDERSRTSEEKGPTRGAGRGKRNIIQGTGVFSEGLAPSMKSGRWSYLRKDTDSVAQLTKPVLKTMDKVSIDKEEEEGIIKDLLRDDFIDDPDIKIADGVSPLSLPFFKTESRIHIKQEPGIKVEPGVSVKLKKENDIGLPSPENNVNDVMSDVKPTNLGQLRPLTVAEILSSDSNAIFYFQLPYVMPSLKISRSDEPVRKDEAEEQKNTIKSLPEGQIGKIQILRSGKARLKLGDVSMSLEVGTQSSFRQDLMSVNLNKETLKGDMIHLSSVSTKIIASPNWERILSDVNAT